MATKKSKRPVPLVNPMECGVQTMRFTPSEQIAQLRRQLEHAEQRSPIEQAANRTEQLVLQIRDLRSDITNYETVLRDRREGLSTALLEHQIAVAKFKELGAIPQPTA